MAEGDYRQSGEIVSIPKLSGKWRRMPDEIRYRYTHSRTECPICLDPVGGVPWNGWFSCELNGCCVALVDTGEVFIPVGEQAPNGG